MSFVNRSRRLGERLGVHGIVVNWNTRDRRTRGFARSHFAEADVIDVSITGAQLLAPITPHVQVGSRVTIAAGGALGSVRIKRMVPVTNGSGLCVFGVEFIELEPPLQAMLLAHLAETGPAEAEVVWR